MLEFKGNVVKQVTTQVTAFGRRSTDPWSEDQPIRSALFSEEQLARHAMSLADSHMVSRRTRPMVSPAPFPTASVAVPISGYQSVQGALLLTTQPGDIDRFVETWHKIYDRTRRREAA